MAHAAREISVGRTDAFHRRIHPAESIDRPAETRGAARILSHLHAGIDENLPHRFVTPARGLQIVDDLRSRGHAERIDDDAFALQDPGELEEIAGLPTGAGTDISAIQFHVGQFLGGFRWPGSG